MVRVVARGVLGSVLLLSTSPRPAAADGFMPHAVCYLWDASLLAVHAVTDALIGLSYVAISTTLALLVYRTRREIPFHTMFLAFGAFIVACGATHFMHDLEELAFVPHTLAQRAGTLVVGLYGRSAIATGEVERHT